jgi:hypothetical protein
VAPLLRDEGIIIERSRSGTAGRWLTIVPQKMPTEPRWAAKFSPPIEFRDGTKLETLAEARAFVSAFVLALPEGDRRRPAWQKAADLLRVAAENREEIAGARKQIIKLALPPPPAPSADLS